MDFFYSSILHKLFIVLILNKEINRENYDYDDNII